jgi:muramoyltetrapeptide carboxypeptidase
MNKTKMVISRQPIHTVYSSPSAIIVACKILFIEDLDEYLFRVLIMIESECSQVNGIKGIVVGSMTKMKIMIFLGGKCNQIIEDITKKFTYSDYFNFPQDTYKTTGLILGSSVTMEVTLTQDLLIK